MAIKVSEHILFLDDNILAVSLFSKQFLVVENAIRSGVDMRFRLGPEMQNSSSSLAATTYGITQLLQNSFGRVEKITVDYDNAKLMLIALRDDNGFVGLVLNKSVNSDYLALNILKIVGENFAEIDSSA